MNSPWVWLALLCAFSNATSDALLKRRLRRENEFLLTWWKFGLALPPLYLALVLAAPFGEVGWIRGVISLPGEFYRAFLLALPLEILAIVLYTRALRLSPLGLTIPFLALTPVFLIGFAFLIAGERVSWQGAGGILLIATGSYLLNLGKARAGWLEPIKAIGRERGSLLMVGVAMIYAVTSSLGKVAITHSSPLFFGATYFTAVFVAYAPIALRDIPSDQEFDRRLVWRQALLPGLFYALMIITHMVAMSLANVAYMISIKRTSLLMAVVYGYLLFREREVAGRLFGAALMLAGFVFIVTAR